MVKMLAIILLVAITIFFGILLINHIFAFTYLYIEYNLGIINSPKQYPKISIFTYIKNCFIEFWYVIAKYVLIFFKYRDLSKNRNFASSDTAILLIHGYMRNQVDWLWFSKALEKCKLPIFTINLKPSSALIEKITANSVHVKINEIISKTKANKIILVGHSMGGLVASYYSEYLDKDNFVKKVITIGTPFHGTKIATVGSGKNAEEMIPDSKFCADLRNKIKISDKQYYLIASKFDNIVYPWTSATLDFVSDAKKMILDRASHLGMLHSTPIINQIIKWIQE